MKSILFPVFGGLGNQMFQVAHGITLARRRGAQPLFADLTPVTGRVTRKWELDCFGVPRLPIKRGQAALLRARISAARRLQRVSPFLHFGILDESIASSAATGVPDLNMSCSICSGYWQGERFFAAEADEVRTVFTFPKLSTSLARFHMGDIATSVAVHVRRGDYVSDPIAHAHHYVCDTDWYCRAMDQMRTILPSPVFYIFSDDQYWASTTFGDAGDVTVVGSDPSASAWVDMARMSLCSHFIISNSSYSWWASYLGKTAKSRIIAPEYWYRGVLTKEQSVLCKDWILL